MKKKVTNLSSQNDLPRFCLNAPVVIALMTTGAFSQNVGYSFSFMQEPTEKPLKASKLNIYCNRVIMVILTPTVNCISSR